MKYQKKIPKFVGRDWNPANSSLSCCSVNLWQLRVLSEPEGERSDTYSTYGEPQLTTSTLTTGLQTADEHVKCLEETYSFFFLTRWKETTLKTYV